MLQQRSMSFLLSFISASLIFAVKRVLRRACVARKGLEQFKAVGEILLGKVKISECHLIGKDVSPGVDAGNKLLPRQRWASGCVQKTYEVKSSLRILRICRGDRPQFPFGIVLADADRYKI